MSHIKRATAIKQWSGAFWCILAIAAFVIEPRADAALVFMMCASAALVAIAGIAIIAYWKSWVWMSTANLVATLGYSVIFHTKAGTMTMVACPPFPYAMALPTIFGGWFAGALAGLVISAVLAAHFPSAARVCPSCEYPLPTAETGTASMCPECGTSWSEAELRTRARQRLYW